MADFTSLCRVCAEIARPVISLLSPGYQQFNQQVMSMLDLEIDPSNGFPTNICPKCLKVTNNWLSLKHTCALSQQYYTSILKVQLESKKYMQHVSKPNTVKTTQHVETPPCSTEKNKLNEEKFSKQFVQTDDLCLESSDNPEISVSNLNIRINTTETVGKSSESKKQTEDNFMNIDVFNENPKVSENDLNTIENVKNSIDIEGVTQENSTKTIDLSVEFSETLVKTPNITPVTLKNLKKSPDIEVNSIKMTNSCDETARTVVNVHQITPQIESSHKSSNSKEQTGDSSIKIIDLLNENPKVSVNTSNTKKKVEKSSGIEEATQENLTKMVELSAEVSTALAKTPNITPLTLHDVDKSSDIEVNSIKTINSRDENAKTLVNTQHIMPQMENLDKSSKHREIGDSSITLIDLLNGNPKVSVKHNEQDGDSSITLIDLLNGNPKVSVTTSNTKGNVEKCSDIEERYITILNLSDGNTETLVNTENITPQTLKNVAKFSSVEEKSSIEVIDLSDNQEVPENCTRNAKACDKVSDHVSTVNTREKIFDLLNICFNTKNTNDPTVPTLEKSPEIINLCPEVRFVNNAEIKVRTEKKSTGIKTSFIVRNVPNNPETTVPTKETRTEIVNLRTKVSVDNSEIKELTENKSAGIITSFTEANNPDTTVPTKEMPTEVINLCSEISVDNSEIKVLTPKKSTVIEIKCTEENAQNNPETAVPTKEVLAETINLCPEDTDGSVQVEDISSQNKHKTATDQVLVNNSNPKKRRLALILEKIDIESYRCGVKKIKSTDTNVEETENSIEPALERNKKVNLSNSVITNGIKGNFSRVMERSKICETEISSNNLKMCKQVPQCHGNVNYDLLKKRACPICNFVSHRNEMLISHIAGHEDLKKYKCGHCNLKYFSVNSLRRHIKSTHFSHTYCANKSCYNSKSKLSRKLPSLAQSTTQNIDQGTQLHLLNIEEKEEDVKLEYEITIDEMDWNNISLETDQEICNNDEMETSSTNVVPQEKTQDCFNHKKSRSSAPQNSTQDSHGNEGYQELHKNEKKGFTYKSVRKERPEKIQDYIDQLSFKSWRKARERSRNNKTTVPPSKVTPEETHNWSTNSISLFPQQLHNNGKSRSKESLETKLCQMEGPSSSEVTPEKAAEDSCSSNFKIRALLGGKVRSEMAHDLRSSKKPRRSVRINTKSICPSRKNARFTLP